MAGINTGLRCYYKAVGEENLHYCKHSHISTISKVDSLNLHKSSKSWKTVREEIGSPLDPVLLLAVLTN